LPRLSRGSRVGFGGGPGERDQASPSQQCQHPVEQEGGGGETGRGLEGWEAQWAPSQAPLGPGRGVPAARAGAGTPDQAGGGKGGGWGTARRWKNEMKKAEWCFKQQAVAWLVFLFCFFFVFFSPFLSFFLSFFFVFFLRFLSSAARIYRQTPSGSLKATSQIRSV